RWWLSMAVTDGKQHGVIRDIDRRGSMPGGERLRLMADLLGTTTDWLLGKVDNPVQPVSEISFREPPHAWSGPPENRIKVLGTGYCDDVILHGEDGSDVHVERVLLETDHVVRLIERPPALWNSPDAYAIYFHGESMEPRFFQGEVGVVDPRRPPSPGDFVVVQLTDGTSDEVITVIVKQLVRVAGGFYQLRQFNPSQTFRIDRGRVKRVHRICTPTELLGG
ncbi:MAG: S24 family peptidase, partial [Croceibacterium sp.]